MLPIDPTSFKICSDSASTVVSDSMLSSEASGVGSSSAS